MATSLCESKYLAVNGNETDWRFYEIWDENEPDVNHPFYSMPMCTEKGLCKSTCSREIGQTCYNDLMCTEKTNHSHCTSNTTEVLGICECDKPYWGYNGSLCVHPTIIGYDNYYSGLDRYHTRVYTRVTNGIRTKNFQNFTLYWCDGQIRVSAPGWGTFISYNDRYPIPVQSMGFNMPNGNPYSHLFFPHNLVDPYFPTSLETGGRLWSPHTQEIFFFSTPSHFLLRSSTSSCLFSSPLTSFYLILPPPISSSLFLPPPFTSPPHTSTSHLLLPPTYYSLYFLLPPLTSSHSLPPPIISSHSLPPPPAAVRTNGHHWIQYKLLPDAGFATNISFEFECMAPRDCELLFGYRFDHGRQYRITFGSHDNLMTRLYNGRTGSWVVLKDTPGILSPTEFRRFWINIEGTSVSLGQGDLSNQTDPIITYTDGAESTRTFTHVSVLTCCNNFGYWKFISHPEFHEYPNGAY
ncbi:hypothetical protein C7M84_020006, partial [Penaeus vannamei]